MKVLSLCVFALLLTSGTSFGQVVRGLDITGVRAYADGNMHLFFRTPVTEACGSVVRVSGEGRESIKTLALAALMSGRAVTVEVEPEKSGNFCNLVYLRLDAP